MLYYIHQTPLSSWSVEGESWDETTLPQKQLFSANFSRVFNFANFANFPIVRENVSTKIFDTRRAACARVQQICEIISTQKSLFPKI